MKNGKKPTREQRKFLSKHGCDPTLWLVVKDTPQEMLIAAYHDKTVSMSIPKTENSEK